MVPFAITLSDLIEKGGSYAGIAAFFGLAVLAILYFAQAREIRRLREWAGRAPERAQELEERVVQQADSARRVVAQPIRRPGEPATAAAQRVVPAATAAASKPPPGISETTPADAEPEEEGSATEHPVVTPASAKAAPAEAEPEPATAVSSDETAADEETKAPEREVVPAGVAASAAAAASAASAAPPEIPAKPATPAVPATPAGGNGAPVAKPASPALPARATKGPPVPAVRRPAPAAAPLRTPAPAARRPAIPPRRPGPPPPIGRDAAPGRRRTGLLAAAALAGVTLIVVGLIAVLGGDDPAAPSADPTTATTPQVETPVPTTSGNGNDDPQAAPAGGPDRADTSIAVLNGTTVAGLASSINDELVEGGYVAGQEPANWTDSARSASVVFYASSEFREQAIAIADQLDIPDRQLIADDAAALAPGADVVVLVGADQA